VLIKQNKAYKAKSIMTWKNWGYSLVNRVYDSNLTRPSDAYTTIYTIDPSFAHTLGKRYIIWLLLRMR